MRWEALDCGLSSKVSDDLFAFIWPDAGRLGPWRASVENGSDDWVWTAAGLADEFSAKAALVDWIDRTITQLSNAKVAGRPQVDEE